MTKIDRIDALRMSLGLSKSEFADLLGIGRTYYSNILSDKGTGNIRLEHIERLFEKLGANPIWLISGDGNMFLEKQPAPVITAEMLRAVMRERFPAGFEATWLGKVVEVVCEGVVRDRPGATLVEMEAQAYSAALVLAGQVNAVATAQGNGQAVVLDLNGVKYEFKPVSMV